jgi:hypothetical protein
MTAKDQVEKVEKKVDQVVAKVKGKAAGDDFMTVRKNHLYLHLRHQYSINGYML